MTLPGPGSVTLELDGNLLAALDRYRDEEGCLASREATIIRILTEWAAGKGLIDDTDDDGSVPVEELNSANDG